MNKWLVIFAAFLLFPGIVYAEIEQEPDQSAISRVAHGKQTVLANSATAFTVGQTGALNPALKVDTSTAGSVTGISIKSNATGSATTITATDPGANSSSALNINTTGTAAPVNIASSSLSINNGTAGINFQFSPAVQAFAASSHFSYLGGADNNLTAGSNAIMVSWGSAARQHSTGALALETDFVINGATDSFVGASTMTDGAALSVNNKSCGTNGACTNESAFFGASKALTGTITNSFKINVTADSGATNNYAAQFIGQIVNGGATPGIAAGTGTGGTSPTIAGANSGGVISVMTGATPTGSNAVIATVTYTNPFPNGSAIVLYPANAATALLSGTSMVYTTGATTNFVITSGSIALTGLTAYSWNYQVIGY